MVKTKLYNDLDEHTYLATEFTDIIEKNTDFEFDIYKGTIYFTKLDGQYAVVVQLKIFPDKKTVGLAFVTSDLENEEQLHSEDYLCFFEPCELKAFATFSTTLKKTLFDNGDNTDA